MPFKNYGVKDGLPTQLIYAAIKDNRGLLWIGTPYGVNWFDGKNFYHPYISSPAGQLYVINFFKDDNGDIWILTFYNGIYKFSKDHFINFLPNTAHLESNSNNVFDMVQLDALHYAVATDEGAFIFDGKKFTTIDSNHTENYSSIAKLQNGNLLLGNYTGLYCYKKVNNKFVNYATVTGYSISKIKVLKDKIWVATSKGVLQFLNTPLLDFTKPSKRFLNDQDIGQLSINNDEIWATGKNIYKINNDSVFSYDETNGITTNVKYIYCDNAGITWFCTEKGLYKLPSEYYRFDYLKRFKDNAITALAKDKKEILWIGTENGIFKREENNYKYISQVNKKNIGNVSWLFNTKENELLTGTDAGIASLSERGLQIKFSLKSTCVFEDDSANIWIGTQYGDIYLLHENTLQHIPVSHQPNEFISSIITDKKNNILIGYRNKGIKKFYLHNGKLQPDEKFNLDSTFKNLRIRCSKRDNKGNMLFGTRTHGLYILSATTNNTWHFDDSNGLNASWVKDIAVSGDTIYMATNNGLHILSGDYDHPFIKQIKFNNEVISLETNSIMYTDSTCIIGNNGLLYYYPYKNKITNSNIPVLFTQITISGKTDPNFHPYTNPEKIYDLKYDQNNISFEFAGIDLGTENILRYRYILAGVDKTWSAATERNFISYNLQPGEYTFKVQAQDADGSWSNKTAEINFIIHYPFWKTWWFISLLIIIAIILVYLIYQYRLRQALKLEKLRSKISTDLHDDIGSTLSSISILSDMVIKENDESQSKSMVSEIKESSMFLMEKMDDIVWSINPANDTLENLLLRIKQFASKVFEAKNINYEIFIDESVKDIKLPMEYRQHIYLILKEAINNLVKYSECTQATIEVKHQNKILSLYLSDNGIGFDKNKIKYGNGLLNMQHRSQLIKSTLIIETKPYHGTKIILNVKIK
ncbi:MAG TPA: two-component regulator propeller domain-containing protein [Chitinophagaceae bacterium]